MPKKNSDIRERARCAGICLWQIAYALGIDDSRFSRMLRRELKPEVKAKIFAIIDKLEQGKAMKSTDGFNLQAAQ